MAMAGDPPPEDPAPTPIWHALINNATDRRIIDFDYGHTTQAHLTGAQAANPQSQIITVQGEPPSDVLGLRLTPGGEVEIPSVESSNEQLEARQDKIKQWVRKNGPTRQFLYYQANVDRLRADVFAAVQAATFYRTLDHATLQNEAHWGILNSHTVLEWDNFVNQADMTLWAPTGAHQLDLINGLKNGTTWRTVALNESGQYIPQVIPDSVNWPASYTFSEAHRRELITLIKSVQVL